MKFIIRIVQLSVWTLLIGLCLPVVPADGQDATWRLNPVNQNWTTPLNWDPPTLPAGTAVFDQSTITSLTFPNTATVGTIQFNAGAPAYNFTLTGSNLNINGAGIVNNSSNRPTFSTFRVLVFRGTSKAGNAVIINPASGATQFFEISSAENATITNSFGSTSFFNSSTAGNAIITNNEGGETTFGSFSDPANPTTAGNATITTRNGGLTSFFNFSTGGSAQLITESGGTVDISGLRSGGMTAGSIEGDGTYFLGSKTLTVGLNNLDTEVGGVIADGGSLGGAGGSLIKVGTGTLTVRGVNTYTGGTTLMDGTLNVSADNNLGDPSGGLTFDGGTLQWGATFDLAPTRAITLNGGGGTLDTNTFSTTISQVITGSGALTKAGAGTLVMTAANTYGGGTTIQEGILEAGTINAAERVSRALGTGDVFLQGGTLQAFRRGFAPVTINIGGNYRQALGGTLALGVAGINGEDYDHVQVGGNAILGGTLAVSSLNGFHPANGNLFVVLRSNGTRSGEFAHVNDFLNNNPNLQRVDIYAPNGAALLYIATGPVPTPTPPPSPTPTPPPSPTPNPKPPIIVEIPEPLPPVNPEEPVSDGFLLAALNPTVEQLTSMFEIPFSGANTQRFNLNDRMAQIQRGSTGFVSPISPAPPPAPTGKEIGKKEVAPVFAPSPQNRWGVWANGWGDWVSVDDDNSKKGYDFTNGGGSVGIDYRITDCLAVGIFGTYARTWTSLNPGDVDVDTGRGGLYATYWNQGFYVNGGIYGGSNSYDTSRQTLLQGQLANGSTSGYEFGTFVDTGYDFHFGNLSFGPVFSAQYTNVHIDSYTERASFLALNIHSDSEESWRTDLGIQASYAWHVGQITVIPSLRAVWEHEYKYSSLPITFSTAAFPGASATVFGPDEGHDSAIINAGAGVQWTPRISTYVGYQGQLGRSNYQANAVTGSISFSF